MIAGVKNSIWPALFQCSRKSYW